MAVPQSSPLNSPGISQIDRAVLTIREMLLRGDFEPGERISELPLTARLQAANVNVSRTPLRLALDRLANEGLLRAWPTGGFVVCEFTLADVWDAIETRGTLEGMAARMAAERLRDGSELETLRELQRQLDELIPLDAQGFPRYLELNEAFHSEIWRLARSPMLMRAIEQVVKLPFAAPSALVFGHAESQHSPRLSIIAQEHHRAIVEAIANHEGARAESLAREHSRVARQNLSHTVEDWVRHIPGGSLISFKNPKNS
ncbi:MAG TPA: GntR family transcriptional regulator [Bryobacteraceae bacterium]|nr:GntR family transcriptional regulator [Bryobacteraceae bacterium]